MKKLAIIGTSYLQLPLIERAKSLGIETHVFAWKSNDVGEHAADYFYPISIIEKENILKKCIEINIDGICTIGSDLAVLTVNYVANAMNLVGNSIESTSLSTNKYLMRNAFYINGDPIPKYKLVDQKTAINFDEFIFPLIIKPIDRSGSRGVYKINNIKDYRGALNNAIKYSFEKKAILEEFVEGKEYSVEYISWKGIHNFLALTEKITTGEPYFIEKGHIEPAIVETKTLKNIKRIVEHALQTLKIEFGASHTEIKIDNDGNIKIIEIGGRMGGDCIGSDLVYYSTGIDYVKAVIDIALNIEPDLSIRIKPFKVKSVFMFNKTDFDELEELKRNHYDRIIRIVNYHPERIGSTTDSSNRCGCYILKL